MAIRPADEMRSGQGRKEQCPQADLKPGRLRVGNHSLLYNSVLHSLLPSFLQHGCSLKILKAGYHY